VRPGVPAVLVCRLQGHRNKRLLRGGHLHSTLSNGECRQRAIALALQGEGPVPIQVDVWPSALRINRIGMGEERRQTRTGGPAPQGGEKCVLQRRERTYLECRRDGTTA